MDTEAEGIAQDVTSATHEGNDAPQRRGGAEVSGDDAEMLAELEKIDQQEQEKKRAKKSADKDPPKKKAEDDDEDKPKAKAKDDSDDDEDDDEDDKPEPKKAEAKPVEKKPEPKKDPEEKADSKSLEAILRTKKRAMAEVEAARADVVREKQEASKIRAEAEAVREEHAKIKRENEGINAEAQRVKSSPRAAIGLLKRLGATEWEEIANYAIAQSANPKVDATFKRQYSIDDGGTSNELTETQKQLAELKQRLEQQEKERAAERQAAEEERAISSYVGLTVQAVDEDEHALVSRGLKGKNPERVKTALRSIAAELVEKTNRRPDPKDVVDELERRLREDAENFGFSVTTKSKPNAGENETAPQKLATSARSKRSGDDDDEEALRRELDEIDAEERKKKRR